MPFWQTKLTCTKEYPGWGLKLAWLVRDTYANPTSSSAWDPCHAPAPVPQPTPHPPLCPTYILKSFRTLSLPHLTHTTSCLGKVCFLHIKSLLLSWGRGTLSSPSMCPELRMSSELSKWRKNKAGLNHLSLLSPAFLHASLTHQNHTRRAWSPIRGDYILKRKAIWMDQSEKAWLIFGKTSPKTQTRISNT